MASGLITSFLGEGLAASRPADPDVAGAIAFYWSTDTNEMSAWLENAWVEDVFGTGGALIAANNLSDVASATTSRTNLGVGTGDSPQFTGINVGHASDTTITRASAGVIAVEGVNVVTTAGGVTFAADISVSDEAYDATSWNGSVEVPTKNAIRDKFESLGGAAWTLVSSTSPSGASEVDVTGLSSYNEVLVIARALTSSVSGVRQIVCSTDNGSTFDTTAANYQKVSTAGIEANADTAAIAYHGINSTAARTLVAHIHNLKGAVKACSLRGVETTILYVGSSSDVTALRINNHTGGTISGGPVYVFAR